MGRLYIIGGAEEKSPKGLVLSRLLALVPVAPVGILTTASAEPRASYASYREVFEAGGREAVHIEVRDRDAADGVKWREVISRLGALFVTGGDQTVITRVLRKTFLHEEIMMRFQAGMWVAGTSAGASMMSETMMAGGDGHTPANHQGTAQLEVGMGFWPGTIIDQHFSQRGRFGRLLHALNQTPACWGIGLDEDTAIEVDLEASRFSVQGTHTVTVLLPRKHSAAGEGRAFHLQLLTHGETWSWS